MMYQALNGLGDGNPVCSYDPVSDPLGLQYAYDNVMGNCPAVAAPTSTPPATASDLASSTATADCDSTQQVCHWYCYIPFMATSDCLTSFQAGTKQATSDVAGAATSVVVAAGSGVASGIAQGVANAFTGNSNNNNNNGLPLSAGLMLGLGGAVLALIVIMSAKK